MDLERLEKRLIAKEDNKLHLYKDTVGKWTIGVGRNIEDDGISDDEAMLMLKNDIARVQRNLDKYLPWWTSLDEVRQAVLAEMAFNMGIYRLMGFINTLKAVKTADYVNAASEMLDSEWSKQVGARATELAEMMRSGTYA